MGWVDSVERELARAKEAELVGNVGKARTAARRAVGFALTELQNHVQGVYYGADFMRQLRACAEDASLPDDVRNAADRLHSRLTSNFLSASEQPVADAMVIINFVRRQLQ